MSLFGGTVSIFRSHLTKHMQTQPDTLPGDENAWHRRRSPSLVLIDGTLVKKTKLDAVCLKGRATPLKTNMTMGKKQPFDDVIDVFPNKHGDFPLSC